MSRINLMQPYLGPPDIAAGAVVNGQIHPRQIGLASIVTDLLERDQDAQMGVSSS